MDVEKLIELVRVHQVLYDTSDPDYMRVKMKDDLWEKIGTELDTTGKDVKEQWRKLRDGHREAMRRQKKRKSGSSAERQKPWTYQNQMEFLLPFMKNRLTQSSLPNSPNIDPPNTLDDDIENTLTEATRQDSMQPSTSHEEAAGVPIVDDIPRKKTKVRSDRSLFQNFMISSENRSKRRDELRQQLLEKEEQSRGIQNDALYQFFLSMYSTTKALPPRYQRQIRNKLFDAVSQAEEQHENEIHYDDAFSNSRGYTSSSSTTPSTATSYMNQNLSEHYPEYFQPQREQSLEENETSFSSALHPM